MILSAAPTRREFYPLPVMAFPHELLVRQVVGGLIFSARVLTWTGYRPLCCQFDGFFVAFFTPPGYCSILAPPIWVRRSSFSRSLAHAGVPPVPESTTHLSCRTHDRFPAEVSPMADNPWIESRAPVKTVTSRALPATLKTNPSSALRLAPSDLNVSE